jgi:hypothetical protein
MSARYFAEQALTHLDIAKMDVEQAADDLPAGNKAEHALAQLREVRHYLDKIVEVTT